MRKFIENDWFGILALFILLIPQVAHTLYVFEVNRHYEHPWFSWCYAIGVDFAILIFTVKGWLRTAFVYLFATLAHNLVYQFMPEGTVSSILISIVQSTTLFSFCHLFFKKNQAEDDLSETATVLSDKAIEIHRALEVGVHFKPNPYLCPKCNASFMNPKELQEHIQEHKSQKEWEPDKYGAWELENDTRQNYCRNFNAY